MCFVDRGGKKTSKFVVGQTAAGFEELIGRLRPLGDPGDVLVGIERPDGRLVDRLLEAGYPVVAVQPNAIKAWREAEVISGAKSDAGDAEVIAQYLRLCSSRLKPLMPFSERTVALRALVRTRTDLVNQRVATQNQLEALLDSFWPGAKVVFTDLTSKIALSFLKRYPTATSAANLDESKMDSFCKRNGYTGRRSGAELVDRLRSAPGGAMGEAVSEACREAVLGYVRVIETLNASIRDLNKRIVAQLGEHPDAEIFTSLPRSATITAAQMLAEWGDCRQAYDGPEGVAALSGMSPVTKQSGKHRSVKFRWACNKRFRNTMHTFADNSRHASPWAAGVYLRARARGQSHQHAIRTLARAWIRVIWRCWLEGVPYQAERHEAKRQEVEERFDQSAA